MNRKRFFTSFFVFWLGVILVSAQTDTTLLTFDNAYQTMQEKNPSLQKARKELEQKEYEKKGKQGLYMPKVSLAAQAVTMSDAITMDLSAIGDALEGLYSTLGNYGVFSDVPYVINSETGEYVILDEANSTAAVRSSLSETAEEIAEHDWNEMIQEKTFATVSANVTWPIFTGGKIMAANKAANVDVSISEEEVRKTEGELLTELVTRYYGLVLAIQAADVMHDKYSSMQKHYSDAEKMFEQGMIAKVELLNAKVELSEAEREYKSAERMVETVRTGLTATLDFPTDTCFVPTGQLFVNKEIPSLNSWIDETHKSNPLLKQIDYKKDLTTIKTDVSKGAYLPNVALMGTYNIADYQLSPYTPDWIIGAGLTWTLFDGMSRQKEIKANKMLTEQVSFAQEKANDDLSAYITKLYNELNNKLQEISELENTLALAEEFCQSTEKAFNEGFKNSTDVAQAQSKLAQAKALRLKTFYEYDVALATLLQVSGTPEDFILYSSGNNTITESIQ